MNKIRKLINNSLNLSEKEKQYILKFFEHCYYSGKPGIVYNRVPQDPVLLITTDKIRYINFKFKLEGNSNERKWWESSRGYSENQEEYLKIIVHLTKAFKKDELVIKSITYKSKNVKSKYIYACLELLIFICGLLILNHVDANLTEKLKFAKEIKYDSYVELLSYSKDFIGLMYIITIGILIHSIYTFYKLFKSK